MNRSVHRSFHTLVALAILGLHGCAPSVFDAYYRALDEGRADDVIVPLTDTLARDPSALDAQKLLGIAWFQKNNFAAADSLLGAYCMQAPSDDQAMYYAAASADSMGNDAKAVERYRAYLDASPNGRMSAAIGARIRQLVLRRMQQDARRAVSNEASLQAAPPADSASVAVLAFENMGDDSTLAPLGRGLAEMMTTDLAKVKAVKVVERLRMQTILEELALAHMNPSSVPAAPRAGRLAGVRRVISGSFAATDDGTIHLDAAAARTSDAEVEAYASAMEPKENIFRAEKKLVLDLLRSLSIPVSGSELEAILTIPTENYFAFVRYAQGLECADHGLYAQASLYFSQAVELDPHFIDAQDQLTYADALGGAKGEPRDPTAGDGVLVPPHAADADAVTSAGERAATTFTQTTGGLLPAPGSPVKTNPILLQHALPPPPQPPRK